MDDLISRQAAIDAVYERIKQIGYENDPLVLSIRQAVREVPSVESEIAKEISKDAADVVPVKRGKWIPSVDRWGDIITTVDGYTCSDCGFFDAYEDRYCPNCGAEMTEENDG